MKETREWRIVEHLMTRLGMMEEHEKNFIISMFENLDPYAPFMSQCSKKQQAWLLKLFKTYQRHEVRDGV